MTPLYGHIAGIGLRHAGLHGLTLVALALLSLLAAIEQIVEEAAGGTLFLGHRGAGEQHQRKRGERRDANSVS